MEHIYNVYAAFKNLCLITKDIVILVIPFLQQMHGNFGDYWRFTPLTIKKMFEDMDISLIYLSFNGHQNASVYIFAIASKNPSKWQEKIQNEFLYVENKPSGGFEPFIGCNAIQNTRYRIGKLLTKFWFKPSITNKK